MYAGDGDLAQADLEALYRDAYDGEPFVELSRAPGRPRRP